MADARSSAPQAGKRRLQLQRQRERRRVRAATIFDNLTKDSPTGELPRAQLETYLMAVLHIQDNHDHDHNHKPLDPNIVTLVLQACGCHTLQSLPKEKLLHAMDTYGEYVLQHKKVDAMYDRFDKDANGALSRAEFARALQAYEDRDANHHTAYGLPVRWVVTDEDLDFILAAADADADGQISRMEMLPALAAWEEMAAMKLAEQEKSACCVVL